MFVRTKWAVLVAVAAAGALWMAGGGAGRSTGLTCPDTGTPIVNPGTYTYQGHFTTFDCGYSDGFHGFDLSLSYFPPNTPASELPARTSPRWCSTFEEKPSTVYSATTYAYAQASGNPKDWDAAFAQAKGFLGQAAAVAHSCSATTTGGGKLTVHAIAGQSIYPHKVKLRFRLSDPSGVARAGGVVFQGKRPIYRFAYRQLRAKNTLWWFNWKPPAKFRHGVQLTFCISATDIAGAKATSCANFSVLSL